MPPEVVCSHGVPGQPHSEHASKCAPDSLEVRSVAYWRERLPPGVSFTLSLWPAGWGYGAPVMLLQHTAREEVTVPPVAGEEPREVDILLPHGATRRAMLVRVAGALTYRLHTRVGDSEDASAWEALIPTRKALVLPSTVARGIRERLRRKWAVGE